MRNPGGHATWTDPISGVFQMDTFTCKHCNGVTHIKPFEKAEDVGGFCKVCSGIICKDCYNKVMKGGGCTPWEKKIEQIEAKERFLRSAGL